MRYGLIPYIKQITFRFSKVKATNGSIHGNHVENSLWKRFWVCRKAESVLKEFHQSPAK